MQRWVERTLFHLQRIFRSSLGHLGDRVPLRNFPIRVRRIIMSRVPINISASEWGFLATGLPPLELLWEKRIAPLELLWEERNSISPSGGIAMEPGRDQLGRFRVLFLHRRLAAGGGE